MNSEELRRRREQLEMSQSELARALDVPVNTIWRWEQSAEKTRVGIRHGRILELALDALATRTAAGVERGEDAKDCRD